MTVISTKSVDVKVLLQKYANDSLSMDELYDLREAISLMSDEQVMQEFNEAGIGDSAKQALTDSGRDRIIEGALSRININQKKVIHLSPIWVSVAAAVMVLLMVCAGWLFIRTQKYDVYRDIISQQTIISTDSGESVHMQLPDGTEVQIGPESQLAYSISDFNDNIRTVRMYGETDFSVVENRFAPFNIICDGLTVRVTGTKFNLLARKSDTSAMLYLREGSVDMISDKTGRIMHVRPNEFVTMDYATGDFTVTYVSSQNDANSLLRADMVFNEVPVSDVIGKLQTHYGINISVNSSILRSRKFTGYLPSKNLDEAIHIVCEAFGLRVISKANDSIVLE